MSSNIAHISSVVCRSLERRRWKTECGGGYTWCALTTVDSEYASDWRRPMFAASDARHLTSDLAIAPRARPTPLDFSIRLRLRHEIRQFRILRLCGAKCRVVAIATEKSRTTFPVENLNEWSAFFDQAVSSMSCNETGTYDSPIFWKITPLSM